MLFQSTERPSFEWKSANRKRSVRVPVASEFDGVVWRSEREPNTESTILLAAGTDENLNRIE